VKIRDYEHYKRLKKEKAIKKKWSAARIAQEFDVGWTQLLAWMARYETEREARKAAKK
jgi:hypothetical protein